MKWIILKSGVALFLLVCSAAAQTNSSATSQTTLRANSTLVLVPAFVQTKDREIAYSLAADDFLLTDDGVPQRVYLDSNVTRPLSLVVLVQTGGAARAQFEDYSNLETMLEAMVGDTPGNAVSIVNFDSRPEAASPFSSDISQWRDAINHPDSGDSGAAIFDGLAFTLNLLKDRPQNTRRAILLLSQTHDDGSKTNLKDILRTAGETDTAIYSVTFSAEETSLKEAFKAPHGNKPIAVGPPSPPTVGESPGPDGSPSHVVAYFDLGAPLALAAGAMRKNTSAEIATLSGGESSSFANRAQLDDALSALTNHLRNSYMLSFYPVSNRPGFHAISVRMARRPDLVVSARSGYWSAKTTEVEQRNR
jgi:VWFA-related protein